MQTYFLNNNSNEIILFFLGWGMDEKPVLPLKSTRDILYLYDYSNIEFDFDYSKYSNVYIISFSAGVSIAAYLNLPNIKYSVGINGIIDVCDKEYGLKPEILEIFENISMNNYLDFRRNYLVSTEKEFEIFNKNAPLRSLKSSINELKALKTYPLHTITYEYDTVLISKDDKILPYNIQQKYWGNKLTQIEGGHFPFYRYSSLDDLLKI